MPVQKILGSLLPCLLFQLKTQRPKITLESLFFVLDTVFRPSICYKEVTVPLGRSWQATEETVGEVCTDCSLYKVTKTVLWCYVLHSKCSQDKGWCSKVNVYCDLAKWGFGSSNQVSLFSAKFYVFKGLKSETTSSTNQIMRILVKVLFMIYFT